MFATAFSRNQKTMHLFHETFKSAFGFFVTAQCSGNNRSDSLKGDKKSYIETLI